MEEFKEIPGFDGRYKISKDGKIISNAREGIRELKTQYTAAGYSTVNLFYPDGSTNKRNKSRSVAYLVLITWGSPRPSLKHKVHFKDGNRHNLHIDNLTWITQSDIAKRIKERYRVTKKKSKIVVVIDGWEAACEFFDCNIGYYKDKDKKFMDVISVYSIKGFEKWLEEEKAKKIKTRGRNAYGRNILEQ